MASIPVEYVRNGLALCRIPRGFKGPRGKGWNRKENAITTEEQAATLVDCNIGLLHEHSGTCAVDIDDLAKSRAWFREEHRIDIDSYLNDSKAVRIVSGRENRAKLLYRLPRGTPVLPTSKVDTVGLEFRCQGVQDVIPPSTHPETKKEYTWSGNWAKIPVLPKEFLKIFHEQGGKAQGKPSLTDDEVTLSLKANGLYIKDTASGKHMITCPWESEHTTRGTPGETAYFMANTNGYQKPAFKCLHTHCASKDISDLRIHLGLESAIPQSAKDNLTKTYSPDEMHADAVYVMSTNTVSFFSHPTLDCSAQHLVQLLGASTEIIMTNDGPKRQKVARLWLDSPARVSVMKRTFAPGQPPLCESHDKLTAYNTWRELPGFKPPKNWKTQAKIFTDHVRYLCQGKQEFEQVMSWLAHLLQRPGEMAPWHVIMFTEGTQGVGRNWLAAVMGRIMPQYAALHTDIAMLAGNSMGQVFNGYLSGKLFCCIDELHASAFAHGSRRMMETLKTTLMADVRKVNPKYGSEITEFNRLRVLILSNHRDAMPIDQEDRRFFVVQNPSAVQPVEYYVNLYGQLRSYDFINSVRQYLSEYDLSKMAMGNAPRSEAKQTMIAATEPAFVTSVRELLEDYKGDLITASSLRMRAGLSEPWMVLPAMRTIGGVRYPKRLSVTKDASPDYVWVLRNTEQWLAKNPDAVRSYLRGIAQSR
jgi:hypothetical protein